MTSIFFNQGIKIFNCISIYFLLNFSFKKYTINWASVTYTCLIATINFSLNKSKAMSVILKTFIISLVTFAVFYLLRGFSILSFLPGGIILFLLLITIGSGLTWGIVKTRRF